MKILGLFIMASLISSVGFAYDVAAQDAGELTVRKGVKPVEGAVGNVDPACEATSIQGVFDGDEGRLTPTTEKAVVEKAERKN